MKPISRRQREVCDKMILGWSSKEIAESLGISARTVEDHRQAILGKYGVRNVVELVRAVYQIGEAGE